jgi:hypothetical protein
MVVWVSKYIKIYERYHYFFHMRWPVGETIAQRYSVSENTVSHSHQIYSESLSRNLLILRGQLRINMEGFLN